MADCWLTDCIVLIVGVALLNYGEICLMWKGLLEQLAQWKVKGNQEQGGEHALGTRKPLLGTNR
eukprot:624137-Ditylum_brightwellii.AAC.1